MNGQNMGGRQRSSCASRNFSYGPHLDMPGLGFVKGGGGIYVGHVWHAGPLDDLAVRWKQGAMLSEVLYPR